MTAELFPKYVFPSLIPTYFVILRGSIVIGEKIT